MGSTSTDDGPFGFGDLPGWVQASFLAFIGLYLMWVYLPTWKFVLIWGALGTLLGLAGYAYVKKQGSLADAIASLREAWSQEKNEAAQVDPLSSYQSSKLENAVGSTCEIPKCSTQRSLHVHHITPRSEGGGNELSNLIVVCRNHHADCDNGGFSRGQQRDMIRGDRFVDEDEIKEYWRGSVG